ncbi:MAG: hypothetical protein CL868_03885 [Cytophagaceae bacterium]|nr:hypothetical protein [Cytophagaceae bacterium]|tara:strand:- start:599 stop:1630 length:1032 start_codon:yes stop_codon:yes gene_type:complete
MNYFQMVGFNGKKNLKLLMGDTSFDNLRMIDKKVLFKRHVEVINLELSYECNRKCDYCPVSFSDRQNSQSYMDSDLIEKICTELSEIRYDNRISLNLYNEPLLDKNLADKISTIRSYLPTAHIGFNSNGDFLRLHLLKKLSHSGLNHICVTLHPLPNVHQDSTMIQRRLFKLLDRLSFDNYTDELNIAFIESNRSFSLYVEGVRIIIQWPDWRREGTNRGGTLDKNSNQKSKRTSPCARPFREFTIFYDGNVQPCCESFHDNKLNLESVGNILRQNIFDLYTSKKLSLMRRSLYDFSEKTGICANCTAEDFSSYSEDESRKKLISEINTSSFSPEINCQTKFD